uniref:THAP domain containing 9 n=1 Tax=Nothobranchius rachovii TaxID=451742 RepID=A0A1A8QWL9_9TELE
MYIHKQTEFDGNQIHGYVDIGAGEIENVVATQALVIMVVAIESWKLPIAYFLINSMNGKERASLVQESLLKVHLAAQIFSSSVAAALEYCEQQLRYPQFSGCAATVDFLRTVDAAFDVLNAAIHLEKDTKHPSHQKLNPLVTLKETESLLRGLKIIGKDNRVVHLHSTHVIGIYEDLVEHPAALCRYLLTYKLSQDHLELFFSAIRACGGHNNNPSVRQFRGAYKCLLVPVEALVPEDDSICDLPDVNNLSEYKEAAISYITGFIVKKLKQRITCMPCSRALTSDESVHPLLALDSGGLQKPSQGITAVCHATERCFQRILKANEGKAPRGRGTTAAIVAQVVTDCSEKNLFPQLHSHMFDMCAESNHVHVLVKMASAWYCKIRLNHVAQQETDRIKEGKTVRKKLTKLIHFYGD